MRGTRKTKIDKTKNGVSGSTRRQTNTVRENTDRLRKAASKRR